MRPPLGDLKMETFVNLISNVGFPIAVCIALGYFIFKIYKDSVVRETLLREEIATAQENNSRAIEALTILESRLELIEADIKEIKNKEKGDK